MQLSDGFIERIRPGPKPKLISDQTDGLHLLVNPKGSKTYYWRAGGKMIRLGRVGSMELGEARKRAWAYTQAVEEGRDPLLEAQIEKAKAKLSVTEAWDEYEKAHLATLKPSTVRGYKRYWNNDIAPLLGASAITAIKPEDIRLSVARAEKRSMRAGWHVHSVMGSFMGWLHSAGHITVNPMPPKAKHWKMPVRERYFKKHELPPLLRALTEIGKEDSPVGRLAVANLVMLHTGQREANITLMEDNQIIDRVLYIESANFKGNRKHEVPLSPQVLALLAPVKRPDPKSPLVFQQLGSKSHNMDRLRTKVEKIAGRKFDHWTMQTHRKTVETLLLEEWDEDADRELTDNRTVDAILGHTVKGASAHYNFAVMLRKKRRILNAWSAILDGAIKPQSAHK